MSEISLRAGLYERVSDDEGGRSRSVQQQNAAGLQAVQRFAWRVAATYSEPDRSASRFAKRSRPEWDALIRDIEARKLGVVVLYEPSRGSRELEDWAHFLNACRAASCLIYVVSHDRLYDVANGRDWRSLAEDGVDSAAESDKTSVRVRRGTADAAAIGRPHGRIAYGYRRTYELTQGRGLVITQLPDPATAPVVREIITRIANGDSISGIRRDLAARGIKSPTGQPRFAQSTIARIVNEGVVYISKRRHNGGPLIDGNWPPIVEADTYWKAVRVLADPARKTIADTRGGIRPGASKWLLSFIATCDKCGAPLSVQSRTVKAGRIPYYRCSSSQGGCAIAPVEFVDSVVSDAVILFCSQPAFYEAVTSGDDREAAAARDEAGAEQERLDGFESQAIDGTISAESFARVAKGIEAHIAELEQRATSLAAPPSLRDLLAGKLTTSSRLADIRDRWETMPLTSRRDVIRTIARPVLRPTARGGDVRDYRRLSLRFIGDTRYPG